MFDDLLGLSEFSTLSQNKKKIDYTDNENLST